EVPGRLGCARGHDIPTGTTAAQLIERRKRPGDVERRRIRGRGGGDEPYSRCLRRQRGVQGERLAPQHLGRGLIRYEGETVADEQEVELSSFARVCDRLENREVLTAGRGPRKPPARHMIACPHGVYAEVHLPARVRVHFDDFHSSVIAGLRYRSL